MGHQTTHFEYPNVTRLSILIDDYETILFFEWERERWGGEVNITPWEGLEENQEMEDR